MNISQAELSHLVGEIARSLRLLESFTVCSNSYGRQGRYRSPGFPGHVAVPRVVSPEIFSIAGEGCGDLLSRSPRNTRETWLLHDVWYTRWVFGTSTEFRVWPFLGGPLAPFLPAALRSGLEAGTRTRGHVAPGGPLGDGDAGVAVA